MTAPLVRCASLCCRSLGHAGAPLITFMFVRSATPHYRPLPSNNPGNPTMLAAIRRASSRVISVVAARRPGSSSK